MVTLNKLICRLVCLERLKWSRNAEHRTASKCDDLVFELVQLGLEEVLNLARSVGRPLGYFSVLAV